MIDRFEIGWPAGWLACPIAFAVRFVWQTQLSFPTRPFGPYNGKSARGLCVDSPKPDTPPRNHPAQLSLTADSWVGEKPAFPLLLPPPKRVGRACIDSSHAWRSRGCGRWMAATPSSRLGLLGYGSRSSAAGGWPPRSAPLSFARTPPRKKRAGKGDAMAWHCHTRQPIQSTDRLIITNPTRASQQPPPN